MLRPARRRSIHPAALLLLLAALAACGGESVAGPGAPPPPRFDAATGADARAHRDSTPRTTGNYENPII